MRWNLCFMICNFLVLTLYWVIFAMGLLIEDKDQFLNLTVFTQAVKDWDSNSWANFAAGEDGECPQGYEAISAEWLGTVMGNTTSKGVEQTESKFTGDILPNPPVS